MVQTYHQAVTNELQLAFVKALKWNKT